MTRHRLSNSLLRRRGRVLVGLASVLVIAGAVTLASGSNVSASTATLARYPYLTDLTSSSVDVVWATSAADTSPGVVTYGTAGNCTQFTAAAGKTASTYTAFGESTPYYQHSVTLKNLTSSTSYCYRVYSGTTLPGAALLSEPPQFPATFTTLPAVGSASSFSFDVLGDFGETSLTNPATGTYNTYQAALDTQIAASATSGTNPALFAMSTGDIAYNDGSTSNYGDANHPADTAGAPERSNIFDARYWGKVGSSLPLFSTTGNHGRTSTFFNIWPESTVSTGGVYSAASQSYPAVDGQAAGAYPSDWYAYTVGGVRFYILDADWNDVSKAANPSLGLGCPGGTAGACPSYQVERDEHWQQNSAEYQWLANDLATDKTTRGSSALRMVFFHYPLRVDQNNYTTQQDVYLQNSAANPNGGASSLEALLAANNVNLVFNGHAHLYERNVAPPGGVPNYVTGGGGAVLTNVAASASCSATDAYARGWDPTHAVGSACGAPSDGSTAKPSAAAQVYHFLKVTVTGTDVTVTPTDSTGAPFDPMSYHFAPDTVAPTQPGAPSAVRGTGSSASNVTLTRGADASDATGVVAYDFYRDGVYAATVPAAVKKWTDVGVAVGTHSWTVVARDQRGNPSSASLASPPVTITDTIPPSTPGAPVAQISAAAPHTVSLSWAPSTDNVAVASYTVYRNAAVLASGLTTASYTDTAATDLTTYSYTVKAFDTSANPSALSQATSVTTLDWTPPTAPTLSAGPGPANEIDLTWSGATDNAAIRGYDVYRDGSSTPTVAGIAGTSFADTGLAANSTHSYVVVAHDAAGNSSPPSNTASATVAATSPAVGPPTNLTASQLPTLGQVQLGWSAPAVGTAASYDVYRGSIKLTSTSNTSYADTAASDSTANTYTVVATDTAGNTASANVSLTPDWTAPSTPAPLTATATSATSVTLIWAPSTDAVGVAGYTVLGVGPNGVPTVIATPPASGPFTITDSGRTPNATYQYAVTAHDAAGNNSQPATATVLTPLFTENFESGAFNPTIWTTPTAGLSTQQSTVHKATWAAEEISTGAATWASAQLPGTYRAVHASVWVNVKSRGTSAGFLKLRSATGAYIAYLYVNASGYLAVRNDAGNVTHPSNTPVTANQWHHVEYYLDTNPGGTITITAALDGTNVTFTTPVTTTETLGTTAIGQIVLGDTVTARTYDIALDDLSVDTQPL